MQIFCKELLTEVLTYWQVTGYDSFGTKQFSPPQLIKGKVFTRTEYFNAGDEESIYPERTIYLDTTVTEGSYLGEGDLTANTNPLIVEECFPIIKVIKITGINTNDSIRKVVL